MQVLISAASILFFCNKTFLLLGKKVGRNLGWFLGAAGALLFIVYFFLIGTPILSVLEIGLAILMTYRFVAKENTNIRIERALGVVTGALIVVLTIIAGRGSLSGAQFFGAFGMLVGTYFLISSRQIDVGVSEMKERIGWLLYGFGHLFTSYIGYQKHEWIFFVFQVWQMLLCLVGFALFDMKERKLMTRASLVFGTVGVVLFAIVITVHY